MTIHIVPFTTEMIADAGELLALRHQCLRAGRPELPPRFEDPAAARAAVEAELRRQDAGGVAAFNGRRMRGYLIGAPEIDSVWGRSAWVRPAGGALAPDQDVELVRDLYAAHASGWVAWGCFRHYAVMPCSETALVERWFVLSFGVEQVHALLDLDGLDLSPLAVPPGVEIRRAGPEDRAVLEELSDVIWRHQVQAPVWGIHLPEREAEQRAAWSELAEDPEATIWLAFSDGQAAGMHGYFPAEAGDDRLRIPDRCCHLTVAGTREWARGRGIGRALTRHGLGEARAAGYRFCDTDWRSTNLLASRFWPRQGFQPVAYRLVRQVDPRIAWAGERRR